MNILHLYENMELGGAETHILTLAKEFSQNNHKVFIGSPNGPAIELFHRNNIIHLNIDNFYDIKSTIEKVYSFCIENEIDIIHCHYFCSQLVGVIIGSVLNIPVVTTVHGVYNNENIGIFQDYFSGIIFVSEEACEKHISQIRTNNYEKAKIIHNSVEVKSNNIKKPDSLTDEKLNILYISRLDNDKFPSINFIIDALFKLAPKINWRLKILGSGNRYNDIVGKSAKVNNELAEERIQVLGAKKNVSQYIISSDVVIGVGRVILEGIQWKKPVICIGNSNYVGLIDKSKLNKISQVNFTDRNSVENLDVSSLQKDLHKIVRSDPELLKTIEQNYKEVLNKYSSNVSYSKHLEVYNNAKRLNKPTQFHNLMNDLQKSSLIGGYFKDLVYASNLDYPIYHEKQEKILMIPNFSDPLDTWKENLEQFLNSQRLLENFSLTIKIPNHLLYKSDSIIKDIEDVLFKYQANSRIADIVVDIYNLTSEGEVALINKHNVFIHTNRQQIFLMIQCKLLEISVINNIELMNRQLPEQVEN